MDRRNSRDAHDLRHAVGGVSADCHHPRGLPVRLGGVSSDQEFMVDVLENAFVWAEPGVEDTVELCYHQRHARSFERKCIPAIGDNQVGAGRWGNIAQQERQELVPPVKP